jgi:hypothetical protein
MVAPPVVTEATGDPSGSELKLTIGPTLGEGLAGVLSKLLPAVPTMMLSACDRTAVVRKMAEVRRRFLGTYFKASLKGRPYAIKSELKRGE